MTTITTQDIQDIAVSCVTDFFNQNVSLNESLAKQASYRGLNSEQLQRAVEATNTLTHLKNIGSASDRTSEFPVADFKEIVKVAFVPNFQTGTPSGFGGLGDTESGEGGEEGSEGSEGGVEKMASFMVPEGLPKMSLREAEFHMRKLAHVNGRALEEARSGLVVEKAKLQKMAAVLQGDSELREHLSASSASDFEFTKVAQVFGVTEGRADFVTGMFKSAQLNGVEGFLGSLRKCASLQDEITHREELEKQAWGWLGSIARGVGSLPGIKGTVNVAKKGWGITKNIHERTVVSGARKFQSNVNARGMLDGTVQSVGDLQKKLHSKLTTNSAGKQVGFMGRVGSAAGKATGFAVDKTVGTAARGTVNAAKSVASNTGKAINNMVARTETGQKMGIKNKGISTKAKMLGAGTIGAGWLATDVSMFSPKIDSAADKSGSVWAATRG